jgi:hypothetical protein
MVCFLCLEKVVTMYFKVRDKRVRHLYRLINFLLLNNLKKRFYIPFDAEFNEQLMRVADIRYL